MRLLLLLVALPLAGTLSAAPALAATASLVRDVNATPNSPFFGTVSELTAVGGKAIFTALEPSTGSELWVSDGTTEGTALLRDLEPGSNSGSPRVLASSGRLAYFLLDDLGHFGHERLWRTDGTRPGTFALTPSLDFGGSGFDFVETALAGDRLFFTICMEPHNCALWRSDGSVAGTAPVRNFGSIFFPNPRELTLVDGTLFFVVTTDQGLGLWRSDGTVAGTRSVKSFPSSGNTRLLTVFGSRLLFLAESEGDELWVSDGTAAGTRPITAFVAAQPFAPTRFIKVMNGTAYLIVDDVLGGVDLWRSDGTAAGTRRVTDFPFANPLGSVDEWAFEKVGDTLLFPATDGLTPLQLWTSGGTPATTAPLAGCGTSCPRIENDLRFVRVGQRVLFGAPRSAQGDPQLWSSDGTGAGTVGLGVDLCRGYCSEMQAVAVAGQLYVLGFDGAGSGIWRTNGTEAGTRRLANVGFPSGSLFEVFAVVPAADKILFTANDALGRAQLWATDGTPAGTDVLTAFAASAPGSQPTRITPLAGGGVVFTAFDGQDESLWKSDGSAAGTVPLLASPDYCEYPPCLSVTARIGGLVFFLRDRQLWRTDGTAAGTVQLTSFAEDRRAFSLVPFQGKALIAVVAAGGGFSFWTSDGTVAGTQSLGDLPANVHSIAHLTSLGPELYFIGSAGPHSSDDQAWRSDGTPAGTRQLTSGISFSFGDGAPQFARLGSAVYFRWTYGGYGPQRILRTDGTAAGTVPILPDGVPPPVIGVTDLTAFGGALYFFATGPGSLGRSLYRSDGTTAGTVVVAGLSPPSTPHSGINFIPAAFTPLGETLLFVAEDGEHGAELWKTDGTAAGTVLVKDIFPGAASSRPAGLVAAGGRIFFTAHDGEHGVELWESDGTEAGTRMVQDLAPGGLSSHPAELTASGQQLFFRADDGVWGEELWVLPFGGSPSCAPSATALCLAGGRYRVEAHWRDFVGNSGAGRAVALTADTGYFWFFDAANVEVILKVLAAEGVNGHTWVFYGALSSVEYTLTVTDTQTGAARRYVNPASRLGSVADTHAFGPLGATPSSLTLGPEAEPASVIVSASRSRDAAATAPCVPSPTRLCLNGGRFAVEARWRAQGKDGVGTAVPLTGDTGYFWFFGAANVEIVLKVLDGRPLNGKFWVFYGALSDVAYTLTVTDTQTGETKTYENPQGRLASVADTGAF